MPSGCAALPARRPRAHQAAVFAREHGAVAHVIVQHGHVEAALRHRAAVAVACRPPPVAARAPAPRVSAPAHEAARAACARAHSSAAVMPTSQAPSRSAKYSSRYVCRTTYRMRTPRILWNTRSLRTRMRGQRPWRRQARSCAQAQRGARVVDVKPRELEGRRARVVQAVRHHQRAVQRVQLHRPGQRGVAGGVDGRHDKGRIGRDADADGIWRVAAAARTRRQACGCGCVRALLHDMVATSTAASGSARQEAVTPPGAPQAHARSPWGAPSCAQTLA
jgi:hypothetical protein